MVSGGAAMRRSGGAALEGEWEMAASEDQIRAAARQEQFLDVIDRDEATRRFHQHLDLTPIGTERVVLASALNRVLAETVSAPIDVPGFDRSNVDGFAVRSADTSEASEQRPRRVKLNAEVLSPGIAPQQTVESGTATPIATGGVVPRGADAVLMIEHSELIEDESGDWIEIRHPVSPGQAITFAGTDIGRAETVLRTGDLLTSREIGVLAALGFAEVNVYQTPRVAIIATGDEIVAPGDALPTGSVYDSNSAILAAAILELGGQPEFMGIVPDDESQLQTVLDEALQRDLVLLSGGTSKGAGDLSYRVVQRLENPGIVAHGVALKPGKPICMAVTDGKPVVILPGFPTSAIFTFHEFVAPVIERLAGRKPRRHGTVTAQLPVRVNSDRGRTEYVLVSLVRSAAGLSAYPIGKGSGSVTTFSHADGFISIDRHTELIAEGAEVDVRLLSSQLEPADLVVIGSHCVGLDVLIGAMAERGYRCKVLHVGSMGGIAAARRGECDVAGIHLLDPTTGRYNESYAGDGIELHRGYGRNQGIVYRPGDPRLEDCSASEAIANVLTDPDCVLVNRNPGSGTRILIDELLAGHRPPGYAVQARSHNAVASAVSQGRADWGLAIDTVARSYGLGFIPVREEKYDFLLPADRMQRPAVREFLELLGAPEIRRQLIDIGFQFEDR